MDRFHVMRGDRRTTVCLPTFLSSLLSIRLGEEPDTEEAHAAIRDWLQDRIDEHELAGRSRISQWLQNEVVLDLVDKRLSTAYFDWLLRIE